MRYKSQENAVFIAIHPTTYRSGGFLAHGVLKEGGMDVYFDKGCEHENLRHAMLSDLCKELGLWEV